MMAWSISLGRILGTEVRIHLTFFLLVAWFAIVAGTRGGQAAAIDAVIFLLAVFACVLAHEYGHVLTARAFGIGTKDITLLPIGGVASIERMPERPGQELVIAIAGPLVNVVIAAVLILGFGVRLDSASVAAMTEAGQVGLATRLTIVNVMLFLFNLLPAFPMDGGRVLRALLSYRLERARATRITARIGQAVAFGLGFLGLFGNPMLIFIALFVFLAASHETYAVALDEATRSAPMRRATITEFVTLDATATIGDAVDALLATSQREFPVVDGGGRLRGVVMREGMIRALSENGPASSVLDVMVREIATVSHRAPLAEAVGALQVSGQPLIAVIDDNERVVGIVTLENLAEYMMVDEATRGRHGGAPPVAAAGT